MESTCQSCAVLNHAVPHSSLPPLHRNLTDHRGGGARERGVQRGEGGGQAQGQARKGARGGGRGSACKGCLQRQWGKRGMLEGWRLCCPLGRVHRARPTVGRAREGRRRAATTLVAGGTVFLPRLVLPPLTLPHPPPARPLLFPQAWEKTRDERVGSWRDFVSKKGGKKQKAGEVARGCCSGAGAGRWVRQGSSLQAGLRQRWRLPYPSPASTPCRRRRSRVPLIDLLLPAAAPGGIKPPRMKESDQEKRYIQRPGGAGGGGGGDARFYGPPGCAGSWRPAYACVAARRPTHPSPLPGSPPPGPTRVPQLASSSGRRP